jgi:UTRA domain
VACASSRPTPALVEDQQSRAPEVLDTRVLDIRRGLPSGDIARALQIRADSQVWQLPRQRMIDGRPAVVETSVVPTSLAPGLDQLVRQPGGALYDLLGREYGLVDEFEEQYLEVIMPSQEERRLLSIPSRTQVVRICGLSMDKAGVPSTASSSCTRLPSSRSRSPAAPRGTCCPPRGSRTGTSGLCRTPPLTARAYPSPATAPPAPGPRLSGAKRADRPPGRITPRRGCTSPALRSHSHGTGLHGCGAAHPHPPAYSASGSSPGRIRPSGGWPFSSFGSGKIRLMSSR